MIHDTVYLLFDIGGTKLRVGVSKTLRRVERFEVLATPPTFQPGITAITEIGRGLANGQRIRAISGATPGHVDRKTGKLICLPNLPWGEQPVLRVLAKTFHAPVFIENDAALAGLAEATLGAGRRKSIVMYYTVSTGIGGARIVNGKIDTAAIGFEPGHQIINVEAQPDDRCSDRHMPGHLEAYASGTALRRRYGKLAEDVHSKRIWDEASCLLAAGITNSIVHWSPNIVVLGGGLMQSMPLDTLGTYVKQNLARAYGTGPKIVRATLGERAGLEGARIHLQQKLKSRYRQGGVPL